MEKKKKLILLIVLTLVLITGLGVAFAAFSYQANTKYQKLVAGDIYMYFNETNTLSIEKAMPGDDYDSSDPNNYFEFTITGKNQSNNDIYYDVTLTKGETPADKEEENRIPDEYLKFRLVEVVSDNSETVIFTDQTYSDLTSQRIYVETIPANTNDTYSKKYRLYMVVSENITIGNVEGADFTSETWNNAFASVKINVTGDFTEKEMPKELEVATSAIKSNLVPYATSSAESFTGGLVAINGTEGDDYGLLYNENNQNHTIREYRYSGVDVDNYIYYNCLDTAGGKTYGDEDYDYATNCELWRIVGIFEENGEEYLKIMNNKALTDIPTTYVIDGTTYTVGNNGTTAFWNKPNQLKSTNYNDWTRAGLQYYLNTEEDESATPVAGYLSTLSTNAKSLIRETTYYLGNVDFMVSTVKLSYEQERDENRKWEDNEPTWNGKVGLLYPSDYGYSASNLYWETDMSGWNEPKDDGVIDSLTSLTSWIKWANHNVSEWFLSPSSSDTYDAMNWKINGNVNNSNVNSYMSGVREVLNLKSNTKVLKGDGTEELPYVVVAE